VTQNRRPSPSDPRPEAGADRFWGQFSQAGSARSRAGGAGRGRPGDGDPAAPEPETGAEDRDFGRHGHGECLEWCPICRSAELFRNAVTPELREQAEALQREAMTVFQAFLAAYSERTARTGQPGPSSAGETGPPSGDKPDPDAGRGREVTDIPLD